VSLFLYNVLFFTATALFCGLFVMIMEWQRIPVGTKSLLVGVHAFWWHPITVWIAWVRLYKQLPDWRECCCILFHDWGYWGCETMDGKDGIEHPQLGAEIADFFFGWEYYTFVLYHSRHLAKQHNELPSLLCWPDKFSMMFDPMWFYLLRAELSGEIAEYKQNAIKGGFVSPTCSDWEWLHWLRNRMAQMAKDESANFIRKPLCRHSIKSS
jgi:hypothetical protein